MCVHGIPSIAAVARLVLNANELSLHPAVGIVCSMLFLSGHLLRLAGNMLQEESQGWSVLHCQQSKAGVLLAHWQL